LRLAYADPPYVGCSRFYDHPDAAKWDDPQAHIDLMASMDAEYDGWALSLSSPSSRELFYRSPEQTRMAAWVKPYAIFKRNVRIAYAFEPVLFKPGRDSSADGAPVGRDFLIEPITLRRGLTGAKPDEFNRWVLDLLGYVDGDEVEDLFPGTAGMGKTLAQGVLM
jgi:hypothetical protein